MEEDGQAVSLDSILGDSVTLLCEYNFKQETDPPDYNFTVIAALNAEGSFTPVDQAGIYIRPKHFMGGAIQSYHWGLWNSFVFRGVLEKATKADGESFDGAYKMRLSSWDIVTPIQHWEFFFHPENEFYEQNLFIIDYLLPSWGSP